jgi:hypothetical protein
MEEARIEVPVGVYSPDGTFEGEKIEFDGREVRVYDGGLYTDTGDPGDVVGFILRLYECPDGYRVHELLWSPVAGRSTEASLYPGEGEGGAYESYGKQEASEEWGEYFLDYFESQ